MITLDTKSPSKQVVFKMLQRENSGDFTMENNDNNNTINNNTIDELKDPNTLPLLEEDNTLIPNTEPKRVKVYVLEDNEWKDTGTGFCMGKIILQPTGTASTTTTTIATDLPVTKPQQFAYLIVNNEESPNQVLLDSKLEGDVEYQRQEETLIVWKDKEGHDIALSFEESIGCDTICNFIAQVQRHLEKFISLVAVRSSDSGMGSIHEIIAGPVTLPSMDEIQNTTTLMDSLRILNANTAYDYLKSETIEFILKNNYINLLIQYFHKAEQDQCLKDLLLLSSIIKTLIIYNNRDIIESIVDDDHIMGIIGILEYDTEFPTMKANHRDYLQKSGPIYKEIFPTDNNDLKIIIKKCFRLQFLKDVVLVRFFDESNINLILDIILDFEACIINFLQTDPFLTKVMELYEPDQTLLSSAEESADDLKEKKRNGIKLLHQCVQMSKNLELNDKTKFYRYLIQKDLFNVLQYAFNVETDSAIRIMATDTIITIIEHDILLIQNIQHERTTNDNDDPTYETNDNDDDHLKQTEDMKLLSILSTILLSDKSPGLREQVVQALNTLLHPDGCVGGNGEGEYDSDGMLRNFNPNTLMDDEYGDEQKWFSTNPDVSRDTEMNDIQLKRYFTNFYEQIAPTLFGPLLYDKFDKHQYDDYLMIHIVKLLSFISTEHNRILSRKFILENGILKIVSKLIDSTHILQLRLTAMRAIKNIVTLNDKYYYRYMILNNLFDPIIDLFKENIDKDNLANSCVLDFFKIISTNCIPFIPSTNEANGSNTMNQAVELRSNYILLSKYLVGRFKEVLMEFEDIPFVESLLSHSAVASADTLIKDDEVVDADDTVESVAITTESNTNNENMLIQNEVQDVEMTSVESDLGINQNGKRVFSQV